MQNIISVRNQAGHFLEQQWDRPSGVSLPGVAQFADAAQFAQRGAQFADVGVTPAALLSEIWTATFNDEANFIANLVMPRVAAVGPGGIPSWKNTFKRWTLSKRDDNLQRAQGGQGHRDTHAFANRSWECFEYMAEHLLDDQETGTVEAAMELAVTSVKERLLIANERDVATVINTAGNYATGNKATLTGNSRWDDTSSDPWEQLDAAEAALLGTIQRKPNALILGSNVARALRRNQAMLGRNQIAGVNILNDEMLSNMFAMQTGIPNFRVIVGSAIYDSANEGQTAVNTEVWNDAAIFAFIDPNPRAGSRGLAIQPTMSIGGADMQAFDYKDGGRPYLDVIGVRERRDELMLMVNDSSESIAGYHLTTVIS